MTFLALSVGYGLITVAAIFFVTVLATSGDLDVSVAIVCAILIWITIAVSLVAKPYFFGHDAEMALGGLLLMPVFMMLFVYWRFRRHTAEK